MVLVKNIIGNFFRVFFILDNIAQENVFNDII